MRKNSARKWLHFTLDLLPLVAIPLFMIYSHRHTLTERTDVEITYKYQTNDVENVDDLIEGNLYHFNGTIDAVSDFDTSFILYIVNASNVSFDLDSGASYDIYDFEIDYTPLQFTFIDELCTYNSFGFELEVSYYYLDDFDFYFDGNISDFIDTFNNIVISRTKTINT